MQSRPSGARARVPPRGGGSPRTGRHGGQPTPTKTRSASAWNPSPVAAALSRSPPRLPTMTLSAPPRTIPYR